MWRGRSISHWLPQQVRERWGGTWENVLPRNWEWSLGCDWLWICEGITCEMDTHNGMMVVMMVHVLAYLRLGLCLRCKRHTPWWRISSKSCSIEIDELQHDLTSKHILWGARCRRETNECSIIIDMSRASDWAVVRDKCGTSIAIKFIDVGGRWVSWWSWRDVLGGEKMTNPQLMACACHQTSTDVSLINSLQWRLIHISLHA